MSFLRFLREKIRDMSLQDIVLSEAEAWLMAPFQIVPGFTGILLRYPIYKILFHRLGGLPIIQQGVTLVHTRRLSVGKHFGVNTGTYINCLGGVSIGDYVLIGNNVTISSGKHTLEGAEPPIFARPSVPEPITIEDDVWIGANAVIMPGITLAKGTVVAANAVVTRSTEPYMVVAGVPAQPRRSRIAPSPADG
ncbi:MAG TPA: acyltransferase [Caulobacteraceae bacterium]|nr:acyltransferase [Caulobacteraceae bacterium]